jgi:hypothetical protein
MWTSGKGAIGRAWQERRPVHCPWRPIADALGNKPISEAEFSALTAEQTWGFTRDEFIGIVDKYAEVLAVPILSELGGSVLGVLSLDVPKRLGLTDLILDSDDAEAVATAAVALIRDDLKAL